MKVKVRKLRLPLLPSPHPFQRKEAIGEDERENQTKERGGEEASKMLKKKRVRVVKDSFYN